MPSTWPWRRSSPRTRRAGALTDVTANFPDAILRRLPRNGGVIMITFVGPFVSQAAADGLPGREGVAPAASSARVRSPTAPAPDREGRTSGRRSAAEGVDCGRGGPRGSRAKRWPAWTTSGSAATTTATTSGRSGWKTCRPIRSSSPSWSGAAGPIATSRSSPVATSCGSCARPRRSPSACPPGRAVGRRLTPTTGGQ